MLLKEGAVSRA